MSQAFYYSTQRTDGTPGLVTVSYLTKYVQITQNHLHHDSPPLTVKNSGQSHVMSHRFLKGRREEVGGASHRHLDSASLTELPLSMMGKEVECGWCRGKRNEA